MSTEDILPKINIAEPILGDPEECGSPERAISDSVLNTAHQMDDESDGESSLTSLTSCSTWTGDESQSRVSFLSGGGDSETNITISSPSLPSRSTSKSPKKKKKEKPKKQIRKESNLLSVYPGSATRELSASPSRTSRRYSGWGHDTMVTITIVKAQLKFSNLVRHRAKHLCFRFTLGKQRIRSSIHSGSSPPDAWREMFGIVWQRDTSPSLLRIELMRAGYLFIRRQLVLCHTTLDLAALETCRQTTEHVVLEDHVLHLEISLGGAGKEEEEISDTQKDIDLQATHYSLARTFMTTDFTDVGRLAVQVHGARGLPKIGKTLFTQKCNPYCVVSYLNDRLQTHALAETCDPDWEKAFVFKLTEYFSYLELTVFHAKKPEKQRLKPIALDHNCLGRLIIPIYMLKSHNVENKGWFNLLKADLSGHTSTKATIGLSITLVCNPIRAALVAALTPPMPVYELPPVFRKKIFIRNVNRLTEKISVFQVAQTMLNNFLLWKNPTVNLQVYAGFMVAVLFIQPFTVFLVIAIAWVYNIMTKQKSLSKLSLQPPATDQQQTRAQDDLLQTSSSQSSDDITVPRRHSFVRRATRLSIYPGRATRLSIYPIKKPQKPKSQPSVGEDQLSDSSYPSSDDTAGIEEVKELLHNLDHSRELHTSEKMEVFYNQQSLQREEEILRKRQFEAQAYKNFSDSEDQISSIGSYQTADETREISVASESEQEQISEKATTKTIGQRIYEIRNILSLVQEHMDTAASMAERILNLFNFTVPFLSVSLMLAMVVIFVFQFLITTRICLLALGYFILNTFFRKKNTSRLSEHKSGLDFLPWNFLSRVPNETDVQKWRVLTTMKISKKKRDTVTSALGNLKNKVFGSKIEE